MAFAIGFIKGKSAVRIHRELLGNNHSQAGAWETEEGVLIYGLEKIPVHSLTRHVFVSFLWGMFNFVLDVGY